MLRDDDDIGIQNIGIQNYGPTEPRNNDRIN
jgi:hypothetical protein